MAYTKKTWVSKETITAAALNNIEDGVQEAITGLTAKANAADVYTKAEVDGKLTSAFTYKGSVATADALPQEGNKTGDVYNVEDTGVNYAWDGEKWDSLSGTVDLTGYLTKDEAGQTYVTQTALSESLAGKANTADLEGMVKYSPFSYNDQTRKTIQLANYDSLSGVTTQGVGVNLAMVSKWDKADFGSMQVTMNLNSKDGIVQLNDEKVLATVDQIPDVSVYATTAALTEGLEAKQDKGDYALKSEIPDVSGFATKAEVTDGLATKQEVGDYALNSALEPLATKEAVAGLKVVDLGTFDKVEAASYAAGADGVYNNKEAVVLTFDTAEGSGVIFNTMTATNSSAQRMYWNNQVLSRTVTDGSGTGWGVLSNFTELQNRAIKSTLFTLTTEADSETIKAAMTNENSKTITASDLDSCLKYGYTIRDYALQSGSIFVGWTGSAYTLTYIGFASPTSEPYVMSVVVNVIFNRSQWCTWSNPHVIQSS